MHFDYAFHAVFFTGSQLFIIVAPVQHNDSPRLEKKFKGPL